MSPTPLDRDDDSWDRPQREQNEADAAEDIANVDVDDVIAECLERLIECGPTDDPRQLGEILPPIEPSDARYVLVELIKMDLAMSAEAGKQHRIERYVDALPEWLSKDAIPIDLVMEEIQLRKESGDLPKREEYCDRFPQFEGMFAQLIGTAEATAAVEQRGAPPELVVGSQCDDFLIIQKLGQGAFAHVYLARQVSMHRLVALKVSLGSGDEPRALAQFDHPNIVRVFDQRAIEEPPLHLLYMQFHPGGTLADVVKSLRQHPSGTPRDVLLDTIDRNLLGTAQAVPDRSPIRDWIAMAGWPTVVAWIGMQLARALDAAHDQGVLHRDVKPANVLLTAEGTPKLADFNVSFAGAAGRAGAATSFGGSIGYMAPEHLRAISAQWLEQPAEVAEAADLYSLAVLLWELWQGQRPFACRQGVDSWGDAVQGQLAARELPLLEPVRTGTASERVLEKTLRGALSVSVEDRPQSGAQMAARLSLALHPEAAELFDPAEDSMVARLAKVSPWLVAVAAILLPNIAGGVFNYDYNHQEILDSEMRDGLNKIAICVNLVAYPLAIPVMVWFASGMVRGIRLANRGERVSSQNIDDTLNLGHRAAVIGGSFWMAAGLIYPLALWTMYPDFTAAQAAHFFISLLICGSVAMIYPFFGLALVSTLVYYPHLVGGSMQDDDFDKRRRKMFRRSQVYLLFAAIIPQLGAALIISSQSQARGFMLTAIAAGVVGLIASFLAFLQITHRWDRMAEVLSTRGSDVPVESE